MDLLTSPLRRRAFFAVLYLSEGAPIGYIWWTLPAQLHAAGVPLAQTTGLSALLALPWTFKFLWAPLVDVLRSSRWTLKNWIIAAQLVMLAALVPLLQLNAAENLPLVTTCLLIHAFAAATQDAAIDALCISQVPEHERGRVNGWMQAGMLVGRGLTGGAVLVFVAELGPQGPVYCVLGVIVLALLVLLFTRVPAQPSAAEGKAGLRQFGRSLWQAFEARETWFGLAFALTAGAGFEAVGAITSQFTLDRGFTQGQLGSYRLAWTFACMLPGSLIGGWLSDRFGHRRMVFASQTFLAATILLLATADYRASLAVSAALPVLLGLVNFGIGLFTASSYALLMDITRPRIAATQFSAFMGATNGCETWAAAAAGQLIARWNYSSGMALMAAVSLCVLPLVAFFPRSVRDDGDAKE